MQNHFEKLLRDSLDSYKAKTAEFNDKPSVLICRLTESESFAEMSERFNLNFDEKILIEVEEKVPDTLQQDKNYFFSNQVMTDELYKRLLAAGADKRQIYVGFTKDAYFDLYPKRHVIYKNLSKLDEVMTLFADEKSRRTFLKVITRLCLPYQYHYLYEPMTDIQYFPKEFAFSGEEVFLDAGVCDGQNIFEFIERVKGKYKYIYGLEADADNFKLSAQNLADVPKLELIHGALYSTQGETLSFHSTKMTGKKGNARVQSNGDSFVQSIAGDALKYPPTFIKMDIEGAEKEALRGLSHTIKTYAPKLAICVYHFQKDFWEIPLLIKELNPRYKLFMRNYERLFSLLETVCYACV